MDTKLCTKCLAQLPFSSFPKRTSRSGLHAWCKPCYKSYKKAYWQKNKSTLSAKKKIYNALNSERNKQLCKERYLKCDKAAHRDRAWARKLKTQFGLTVEDYNAMFEAQQGLCRICRQPESQIQKGRVIRLAVDHCHETDVVRGLLCRACNTGLGQFRHSPKLLEAAMGYLSTKDADSQLRLKTDHPAAEITQVG